ncbi:MAG: phosphoribosylanthranilate isomerase, partial [Methanomicrobium sp.]|nr:phosphoribosylanthranilate isomerase [Methanomicrobium sp.]
MRVKICGVTTVEDALFIEEAGADAVGVVISAESKRNVSINRAKEIFASLGPFITRVVVTHTESYDELNDILSLNPDAVQISTGLIIPETFHGRVIRVLENSS